LLAVIRHSTSKIQALGDRVPSSSSFVLVLLASFQAAASTFPISSVLEFQSLQTNFPESLRGRGRLQPFSPENGRAYFHPVR
jgi:hypothetical protein